MRYAIAIAALLSAAQGYAGEVVVSAAWARATAPGQNSAAVYLRITSQQQASIVAVSSPAADSAEMHSMTHDNGMMKMRELEALPLPAKKEVVLGSGGNHIMLIGLKKPLKAGGSVPLTLTVQFADQRRETVAVQAEVKPLTASRDEHEHHDHQH